MDAAGYDIVYSRPQGLGLALGLGLGLRMPKGQGYGLEGWGQS